MKFAASGSVDILETPVHDPAQQRRPSALSVLDTTELRWCVPGPLPSEVGRWFTGSTGVAEQRCDTYLLGGRCDIGVKRRSGDTLELKVRQSLDGWIELGEGLAGSLEVWRKWSPADCLVKDGAGGRWVDVHKSVVKRRFSIDGTEIAFSSDPQVTGAGCDVEIAEVTVGAVQVWMFAFEAFGPPETRRDALLASWRGLVDATPWPKPVELRTGRAMSYPEWLALTVSVSSAERGGRRDVILDPGTVTDNSTVRHRGLACTSTSVRSRQTRHLEVQR